MGGCLVSSLSMARFKDTNNVLALAFSVLILATWLGRRLFPACVNADMIEFVGLISKLYTCTKYVPAVGRCHSRIVLPPDCVFART